MMVKFLATAGLRYEFAGMGDFFRYMEGEKPIQVTFYANGAELERSESVQPGYSEKFQVKKFDRIAVVSAETQEIQLSVREGSEIGYDRRPTGDVRIVNPAGPFTCSTVAVSNVAGSFVLPENADRRYLLIQNNSQVYDLWIRVDGVLPAVGSGLKIEPGGSWEIVGYCPIGQIGAISEDGVNPAVSLVEG